MKRAVLILVLLAAPAWAQAPPPLVTVPDAIDADADNYDAFVPLATNAKVLAWRIPKASGIRVLPQYNPGETIPREFYLVRCKKQGDWEFIVSGVTAEKLTQVVCVITVGKPVPPVPPGPDPPGPTPPAPPGPSPIAGDGLRVLIVFESADATKLTAAQQNIIHGKTVRDYLQSHCAPDPDVPAWKAYRMWDPDTATGAVHKSWQDAMKRPRKSLPWLIISNPQKGGGWEGPLPASVDETIKLLKQYGGE